MPVRIRLRLRSLINSRVVETVALVNSGFTTERPQLLVPTKLAEVLGFWPPPPHARLVELATAGGPVRNYLVYNAVEVEVVEDDRVSGKVVADAIVSGIEEEVLVNDVLGEELGIVILGLASGRWRFRDDPPEKVRRSYPPQVWI